MNNAKLWLVVSPQVGLPVFLGAVAVGSFAVHIAVLSKTNWYQDYLLGQDLGTTAGVAAARMPSAGEAETAKAAYVAPGLDGAQEVTIVLQDGTVTRAILKPDDILAVAGSAPPATLHD